MDKEYIRKTAYMGILLVLIVLSFFLLRPLLMSVVAGVILASLFIPLYRKFRKKIKSANFATALICLVLIVLIILPIWFLTPILLDQSIEIYMASQRIDFVTPLKSLFPSLFSLDEISNQIGSVIYSFVTNITNYVMNVFSNLILNFPTIFLKMIVTFFTFFFVVRDNDKFLEYIQSILPFPKKVEERLFKSTKDITYSVLYGQIIIGILQGIFVGISFFIFGLDNALFLGLLACLAGIFPIIGTAIVWLPVAIFLLVNGTIFPAIGVMAFGAISAVLENAIKPAIVSKKTNVHTTVILFGMIGGILTFGIWGFVIGPLILSYLLIVLEIFRDKRSPGFFIQEPEEGIDIKMNYF